MASQNKVATGSGFDANVLLGFRDAGDVNATTLAAIAAFLTVLRIEGEYPPETSVPRPTWRIVKVRDRFMKPHEAGETDLDPSVQHIPDLCDSAGQVEVTCWTMADPTLPFLHQL